MGHVQYFFDSLPLLKMSFHDLLTIGHDLLSCSADLFTSCHNLVQSTLVISTSVISNNRLSRRENLIPVLT